MVSSGTVATRTNRMLESFDRKPARPSQPVAQALTGNLGLFQRRARRPSDRPTVQPRGVFPAGSASASAPACSGPRSSTTGTACWWNGTKARPQRPIPRRSRLGAANWIPLGGKPSSGTGAVLSDTSCSTWGYIPPAGSVAIGLGAPAAWASKTSTCLFPPSPWPCSVASSNCKATESGLQTFRCCGATGTKGCGGCGRMISTTGPGGWTAGTWPKRCAPSPAPTRTNTTGWMRPIWNADRQAALETLRTSPLR